VLGTTGLEVGFVHNEQWCAVGGGKLADVHSGDPDHAVGSPVSVAWPDFRIKPVQFCRGGRREAGGVAMRVDVRVPRTCWVRHDYIRSGAETPSRARPLASTCRAASHSASRAKVSGVASSSPCGSTRATS